jgi:hypothetical protein
MGEILAVGHFKEADQSMVVEMRGLPAELSQVDLESVAGGASGIAARKDLHDFRTSIISNVAV